MLLTVSKRLEFSTSRRLYRKDWSERENLAAFGPESAARYGTGRNYAAYLVFSGPVDETTGMLINISDIKDRAEEILHENFDHKFLNEDNPVFRDRPPTVENVAAQLFDNILPAFADVKAKLAACHLQESTNRSATRYVDGTVEGHHWFEFSAARRTISPKLSEEENNKLFGAATNIHGHNYRARFTLRRTSKAEQSDEPLIPFEKSDALWSDLREELDHRYLNELAGLKDRPLTTESLAQYLFDRAKGISPLHRVRLHERDDFFAEHWKSNESFLGMRMPFYAAHRLHAKGLSEEQNTELYGKCNNAGGHGHGYAAEATVGGDFDQRSGTLYDFGGFREGMHKALNGWNDKHLDVEAEEFRDKPSTGENIVRALWPKMDKLLNQRLVRLRLWETPNNRFTLRRL